MTTPHNPKIAIVGTACLFPGALTPDEFWANLSQGMNTTSLATDAEFGVDPSVFYDPKRQSHDTIYALRGGFIRAADLPGVPVELDKPLQWAYYVAQQALNASGYASRADVLAKTGLVLGNLSFPTRGSQALFNALYDDALEQEIGTLLGVENFTLARPDAPQNPDALRVSSLPAAHIARAFGLGGSYYAIDAACASSLYAVGLACKYLQAGHADMVLAGAVNGADPLFVNMGFTHFGAYPTEDGNSRPLDADSQGLVSGEGAAMFVLKRLDDAVRDGDTIHAVIAGIGLSNDGRGRHPLTPNPRGQMLALERAYTDIAPTDVQYVECHASGTPVGDRTEINSMAEFFGQHGNAPLIGSVKSNVGHLLTVAGAASMLKAVLSIQHGTIPPTVGVRHPMTSTNGRIGAAQVVIDSTPFPASASSVRRAGINAFGFGGVSAHLILEQYQAQASGTGQAQPANREPSSLAIVGMDAMFGDVKGIDALAHLLYEGKQAFKPLPPKRWKGISTHDAPHGAYIESFDIDLLRHKFPPKDDDQPIPQHLLLLKVADNALQDAKLTEGRSVAVIVALGTELSLHQFRARLDLSWQIKESLRRAGVTLTPDEIAALEDIARDAINPAAQVNQYTSYIGNIIASRVAAQWDFSGPVFTVSADENSALRALELADLLLADGSAEAVVIGAVDLAGSVENVKMRGQQNPVGNVPVMGFDQVANGWLVGEGAGAIVVKRAQDAQNERVYAYIDSLAFAPHVATAAQDSLAGAGITAQEIGYLEAHASGIDAQDRAEIAGLHTVYANPQKPLHTALGSIKANIGHTFNASGIASIIKAALVLHHRFVPAVPAWSTPKHPDLWRDSPFYVPQDSRTWLTRAGETRRAAVSSIDADGLAAHVILREGTHANQFATLRGQPLQMILVDGESLPALLGRLAQLETALDDTPDLQVLASRAFNIFKNRALVLALVARDADALRKEITAAMRGLPTAVQNGKDWYTPAGSAFSPRPIGEQGEVAFVFPGAFNSYPGLGQDWLWLFPQAHDHLHTLTQDAADTVVDHALYQRTLASPTRPEIRAFRSILANDQVAMMKSGTTFAVLFTHVMRNVFKLKPRAAFGYSLGEGSMYWAMGVWKDADTAAQRFEHSPLFRSRLFGRKEAVRAMWGLLPHESDDFWASYVLTAPVEHVMQHIQRETRVYITHINTPQETVIAGDIAACERVIAAMGVPSVRAPFEVVIHNETMISEFDELFRAHSNPIREQTSDVRFYSAADYAPVPLDQATIARNIARVSCKLVDFPRLINRVYADGARIFVELGPGVTCARWVSDTLGEREHLSVSIDNLRANDHTTLLKLLARLASHRVALDFTPLYASTSTETRRELLKTITLGGTPIQEVIHSAESRQRLTAKHASPRPQPQAQPAAAVAAQPVSAASTPVPASSHAAKLTAHADHLRAFADTLRQQLDNPSSVAAPVIEAAPASPRRPAVAAPSLRFTPRPPIFDYDRIDQFARGSIEACFGPEYAIYDTKRAPRIPNTDLLFVTRVVEVNATRLITKVGSSIVTEYDVTPDMWFYADNSYPFTPYSVLMEMALQPCGFLSAFMGPTFAFPEIDFYFRNLDGFATLHKDVDLRGRTLVNRVELLSSTVLQGIIIQKYKFDMMLDGESFFVGESSFGYFTLQALSSQTGLDMGKPPAKWHEASAAALTTVAGSRVVPPAEASFLELPSGRLAFVTDAQIAINGGTHGKGYVYGRSAVTPRDWFFKCHFHQDPVMPGSLGLETISQAIQLYAIEAGLAQGFKQPRFGNTEGNRMVWKYRGQVLSDTPEIHVEVSVREVTRGDNGQLNILADASLWNGALRIYEFKQVGVTIQEG